MKTPDQDALDTLRKASITDPVIAGNSPNASNNHVASVASNASVAGKAGRDGTKFTIRLDKELLGRIRAAYLRDLANGFSGSLSAWAAASLEKTVQESEYVNNNGQPYQPIESGSIPTGILPNAM